MNLQEGGDAPVIWRWGDTCIAMPVWTIDDLKVLLARLQTEKVTQLRQACAEVELSALEQAYVLARARWQGLGLADALAYFRTVEGVAEALRHALTKAGIGPEQIGGMLAATPFLVLVDMAQDVVGLEPRDGRPAAPAGGGQWNGGAAAPDEPWEMTKIRELEAWLGRQKSAIGVRAT